MYCRAGHPALDGPQDETTLAEYEFALLLPEGQRYPTLHRRLQEEMGERRCGFSTFNLMTRAAMIAGSDMLGLTTERLFAMVSVSGRCRPRISLPRVESRLTLRCTLIS